MSTPQTDTPETDASTWIATDSVSGFQREVAPAMTARTLERRAIAAEARVNELEAALRLRPITDAGPVPNGAVRLWVFYTGGNWVFKPWKDNADTHFIDIYPPQQ